MIIKTRRIAAHNVENLKMFYLMAISGNPSGELISKHHTAEQAEAARLEAIETDAENLLYYGIEGREEPPTYAQALEYARDFFYIVEVRDNE